MAPTRVVLYSFTSGSKLPVAKFACTDKVTLTVLGPEFGELACDYFDHRASYDAAQRLVRADVEPEAFMRALVQPSQSSYVWFDDHSGRPDQ